MLRKIKQSLHRHPQPPRDLIDALENDGALTE
jgi:hypothetical protein